MDSIWVLYGYFFLKLSKKVIDGLPSPASGQDFVFDDQIKGFGIRISPGGTKSFILNYRSGDRKKRVTIGKYGVFTVDQARRKALEMLADASKGSDPAQKRKELIKGKPTFRDLVDRYRVTSLNDLKPSTRADYLYFLNHLLLPRFASREIQTIRRDEVEDMAYEYRQSVSERTGRQISPGRVNKLLAFCSRLFTIALQNDWITKKPTDGIRKFHETPRTRICSEPESQRIIEAIHQEDNIFYKAYFLVLWLTMARRGEIQKMKWDELDLDTGLYHMPETKAKREFTIPLSEPAINIIKSLPDVKDNPYVFASTREGKPINGISAAWKRICERAGVSKLRLHDVRRTCGSNLIMNGASLQEVAQLLNHSNLTTTQRYAQLVQGYKQKKMAEHADRLKGIGSFEPSVIKAKTCEREDE